MLSKPEAKPKQTPDTETEPLKRTTGIAFASIFYFASGIYYLAFPILTQDLTQIHLLSIGALSIITGYLLIKFTKGAFGLLYCYSPCKSSHPPSDSKPSSTLRAP